MLRSLAETKELSRVGLTTLKLEIRKQKCLQVLFHSQIFVIETYKERKACAMVEQKILLLIKNISQGSSTSILKKMGDDNINVYDLLSMRKSLGL